MNYRHAFHAGNHCDALKHIALIAALQSLRRKDKPFFVLDTHAGRGRYDLSGEAAQRSREHEGGVGRLAPYADEAATPAAVRAYLAAVRDENPPGALRWYPGSPALIRAALRADDRFVAAELHPVERDALSGAMDGDARVRIDPRDGYEAARALTPPRERRGLVLIDPPFEAPGEFERLAQALKEIQKRWASGALMIWYPCKDEAGEAQFLKAAAALGPAKSLRAVLSVCAAAPDRLSGSGLYVVNPPFGLGAALEEALPFLARRLAAAPGAGWRLEECEGDRAVRDAGETLAA